MASRYGLQVRAAGSSDAADIAELMAALGRPVAASLLAARLDALQQGVALLALEWGPPSGLVVATWMRTLEADQPVALISTLVVAPDERRRGIGRVLLKAAAQAARVAGCGTMQFPAPVGCESVRGFCLANGFAAGDVVYTRPLRKKSGAADGGG